MKSENIKIEAEMGGRCPSPCPSSKSCPNYCPLIFGSSKRKYSGIWTVKYIKNVIFSVSKDVYMELLAKYNECNEKCRQYELMETELDELTEVLKGRV